MWRKVRWRCDFVLMCFTTSFSIRIFIHFHANAYHRSWRKITTMVERTTSDVCCTNTSRSTAKPTWCVTCEILFSAKVPAIKCSWRVFEGNPRFFTYFISPVGHFKEEPEKFDSYFVNLKYVIKEAGNKFKDEFSLGLLCEESNRSTPRSFHAFIISYEPRFPSLPPSSILCSVFQHLNWCFNFSRCICMGKMLSWRFFRLKNPSKITSILV